MSFLPHKKFTWADFGGGYILISTPPPVATPLQLTHPSFAYFPSHYRKCWANITHTEMSKHKVLQAHITGWLIWHRYHTGTNTAIAASQLITAITIQSRFSCRRNQSSSEKVGRGRLSRWSSLGGGLTPPQFRGSESFTPGKLLKI